MLLIVAVEKGIKYKCSQNDIKNWLFHEPKWPQSYSFPSIYKTVPTTWKVMKSVSEPKLHWHALAIRRHSEQMLNYVNWWVMKHFFVDFYSDPSRKSRHIYQALRIVTATSLHFLNFVCISGPLARLCIRNTDQLQRPPPAPQSISSGPGSRLLRTAPAPGPCLCLPKPVELMFPFLRCS